MKFVAQHEGDVLAVEVERHGSGYIVKIDDREISVDLVKAGESLHSLRLEDGTQFAFVHQRHGTQHEISFSGAKAVIEIIDPLSLRRKTRDDEEGEAGDVNALMPGRIVRVLVEPGQTVSRGTGLLILEAMKMENEIQAPIDGTIKEVFVTVGDTVESGAPLVHIT
ncbi:MAG TPA: biotin/lipoyl-containing protein [Thermoanaerobaculia bacterium]|jgi:3-methylcrotonyl-CoA carboxylase alpha subunit